VFHVDAKVGGKMRMPNLTNLKLAVGAHRRHKANELVHALICDRYALLSSISNCGAAAKTKTILIMMIAFITIV